MTHLHTARAVTATGGASAKADAAAGTAAAAVGTLRCEDFFSVLAGSLLCLNVTVSTCCTASAGAQCWGHSLSLSTALSLFFILVGGLVHDDQLVLLPVAGLGIFGAI